MPSLSSESLERRNSPYINRFLQPDTVIPDLSNPQSWNRYSYVTNRPVNFNDPTGHAQSNDDQIKDGDGKCDSDDKGCNDLVDRINKKKILAATVKIGFANSDVDKDGNYFCPDLGPRRDGNLSCAAGLGTLVGDNQTIYTAWHTYDNALVPSLFYFRSPDGTLHATSDFTYQHINGTDVLIIHLNVPLSGFVPAEMAQPSIFHGGEEVSVAYQDQSRGLHVFDTYVRTDHTYLAGAYGGLGPSVYNAPDPTVDPSQNWQFILNGGDSGGGVFYNGYFVGVSSHINPPGFPETMVFEQP